MTVQIKNFLIGVFLIGAIGVLVSLVMFLRPSVGDERQTIFVRFSNINKINIGTRVLFAGKAVGEVTEINQIYHARETQPSDPLGRLYFYQLTLKIDSKVRVYNTDLIAIQTSGLLGEKSIGITPKAPPTGTSPQLLTEKTPYYADSVDPIENTFNRLSDIGQKMEDTIDLVKNWVEENSSNLSQAVSSFGSAMQQVDIAAKQLNDGQLVSEVKEGVARFNASMQKVEDAIAQMQQAGVFENVGSIAANMQSASTRFESITDDIASGKGTFGKLIANDDMYLRLTAILSKLDTTMNDVNHYGVLFHLNKGWQMMRTKRLTAMNALDSPSDFKQYFQSEIDQINTAMARISMMIDKAQDSPENNKVVESAKFKQNFAELLRQVDEMSDNLRLYNEKLMEQAQ